MKLYTKKLILAFAFCLSMISAKAQLPYTEDFDNGTCNTNFPINWTSATGDWLIDDNSTTCLGGVPECTVSGSSGGSVLAAGDGVTSLEAAVSASFATLGFQNILVDWNGYRSSAAFFANKSPDITFEFSFDDVTYTVVPGFTDITANDDWQPITTVALPSSCDNVATVYLRWSYTGSGAGAFFAFDDLNVTGSALNVFYWNGGAVHDKTSWGVNLDGSGANPGDFVTSKQTFNFYNTTTTNFAPTLTADWAVSGGSVFINVGDGATRLTNFTIPASFSLSLTNATLTTANNSTLTLANTVLPPSALVTLNTGSTIDFAQTSTVTLYARSYSNLTISGGAAKLHGGTGTVINGILNLSSATSNYSMSPSTLQTMTLSGTCVGTGSLLTGNSNLTILGTGALGTLRFGTGSTTRQIRNLVVNRTASGSITLGSDLSVNGSAVFTAGNTNINGHLLACNGPIAFPATSAGGAFIGSTASSFSVGGATGAIANNMHMDQTSATTRALLNLTVQRTSTTTVTLDTPLEIWGSITPTVGTFAAGTGNLTIKSSATVKGRVGRMGANGDLTGNVTVETLARGGTAGWTTLGSAGVTTRTFADWNDEFAITCASCPDGSMVGSTVFTSIVAYDETLASGNFGAAAHYVDITNITNSMGIGKGWWVFLGTGLTSTSDILLDVTGTLSKGNLTNIPLTVTGGASPQNGWALLANPYPSPISFTTVINGNTGNCENTLYVWNPDLNGGNGDFAIFTPSVGSVPAVASGGVDNNIPTGQGFYLRATAAFNLSPTESWKTATASANAMLKTQATYPSSLFILNLTGGGSKNFNTMTAINMNPSATMGYDNSWDAHHLSPGYGIAEIFSMGASDDYKLNSIPTINGSVSIPIKVISGTSGAYQIAPLNINNLPAGACVTLFDRFTNTTHNLKGGAYSFNFMDTTTVNRFILNITVNQTSLNSSSSNASCTKNPNGKIIASGSTTGPWNYVWKDDNGNIIKTTNGVSVPDTLKNLGAGDYSVDVTTVGSCDNANGTFNIVVASPLPTAGFSVNADSLDIYGSTPFMFTNSSANASNYTWYFGDGNSSTVASPTHTYATAGEYNVWLYAVNPACGDSSNYNYLVKAYSVASPTLAGITTYANSDNNIKIGKDANGIYVQLGYDKSTKATVSVSNVLGQMLITPKTIEGTTERFYIDVTSKDQLLFITVSTGEKRKTERIFSSQ